MAAGRLEVVGPYDAWHAAAREGRWSGSGVARRVLLLVGPEGVSSDAPARARAAAAPWLGKTVRGVLPLIAVEPIDGRVAWVHEHVDGLGLGHVVGAEGQAGLSSRAAAEIVARVAEVLSSLPPEMRKHRGPEPQDLLVDGFGRLQITGFYGPFAPSPWMRVPGPDVEGDSGSVYRLGVLLAHLLAGVPPQPASDPQTHEAMIRRALIRVMARPGPAPTERFSDWIRGMLAWDPSQRPPLSSVGPGLRKTALELGADDLVRWCSENVEGRRQGLLRWNEDLVLNQTESGQASGVSSLPTHVPTSSEFADTEKRRRLEPLANEDDETQEAEVVLADDGSSTGTRPMISRPTLPVLVGPPPEALRKTPKLPADLFGPVTQTPAPPPRRGWGWKASLAYAFVVSVMACVAILLIAYLLLVPPDPRAADADAHLAEVGLAEALSEIPDPLVVSVPQEAVAPGVQGFVVLCDAKPLMAEVPLGAECVARGLWQGKPLEFRWVVAAPERRVCFRGGTAACEVEPS